jgi:hypothetical protein
MEQSMNIFDIFKNQPDKIRTLQSYQYVEYLEQGGGTDETQLLTRGKELTIRITDRDSITLPADAFLHVRFRIAQNVKLNNSYIPYTTGKIAPVNGGFNLFQRAQYLLSGEIAEDILRPGYTTLIKGLTSYSQDYELGQGVNEFWYRDVGDGGITDLIIGEVRQLRLINVTAPGASQLLQGNAADPHRLFVAAGADTNQMNLYFGDQKVSIYKQTSAGVKQGGEIQLVIAVATGVRYISYDGIANDDLLYLYVGSQQLVLLDNVGTIIQFRGATTTFNAIKFDNGNAIAVAEVAARLDNTLFNSIEAKDMYNSGYEARRLRGIGSISNPSTTNKSISLFMPLRRLFPLLKENPYVMQGIEQEFKFDLNDFEKILFRDTNVDGNADGRIVLQRFSIWMPVLRLNKEATSLMDQMLKSKEERKLNWHAIDHSFQGPRNGQESSWVVSTTSHRPTKCYIFFQSVERYSNQQFNNMIFDNYDMNRIFMRINSDVQFPNKEYRINYGYTNPTEEDYARVYSAYLNDCMASHSDGECLPAVSYEDFKNIYPLYVFDFTAQDDKIWEYVTQAVLTVEYRLAQPPTSDYYINAVIETERQLVLAGVNGRMTRLK